MSRLLVLRLTQLVLGVTAYGIGVALMVEAAIGVSPWDVLAQGLARITGIAFGWVTIVLGAVILLIWIPLRQRPGLGTVLNALVVGAAAQAYLTWVPAPTELWLRIGSFVLGLVVVAVATGAYIGSHFGPGPRDGLMTGLHARTGWPIWAVRTGIEVVVVAIGWALGGNVGVGTLAFALFIGPMVHVTMPWFSLRRHMDRAAAERADPLVEEPGEPA
ncbi:MAG: hypothetical protein BGO95_02075 [Micrococcales bacterium 73-13]|nr:MAG: hypothetical protein BGO95_02075 [Micrococcales bacterium 73-13]